MSLDRVTRPCPLCNSRGGRTTRSVAGWPLIVCGSCRFLYAPEIPGSTATELDLPDDYEPVWRARHRQIHQLLTKLLPEGDLIVDVGAGFAELGRFTAEAGRFRYLGFEPSKSVAAAARRRAVAVRADIFRLSSLGEPAGAVVLDNVIEHVADPVGLLGQTAAALRDGGVLVVIVPNRYDVRQIVPTWRAANHWIPPEHINYFTPKTLGGVFKALGLRARPFGFRALRSQDWRYWPRAALEGGHIYPFGLNCYGVRSSSNAGAYGSLSSA